MSSRCWCGAEIPAHPHAGRPRKYCKPEHWYRPVDKPPGWDLKRRRSYDTCTTCGKSKSKTSTNLCTDCDREARARRQQYADLVAEQGNLCRICNQPSSEISKHGKIIKLCVDHDHTTGATRGLLCGPCNRLLGLVNDDVNVLTSAGRYLRKHAARSREVTDLPAQAVSSDDDPLAHAAQRTKMICQYRDEGMTFKEIGRRLGITRQRVTQLWQRAQSEVPVHQVCWCGTVIPQDLEAGKPRKYCRPEHAPRTYNLKTMTVAHYNDMVAHQRGCCAICARPERKGRALFADRCPRTGAARELLCGNCNKALSESRDDPSVLDNAVKYLMASPKEVFIPSPRPSACPSNTSSG